MEWGAADKGLTGPGRCHTLLLCTPWRPGTQICLSSTLSPLPHSKATWTGRKGRAASPPHAHPRMGPSSLGAHAERGWAPSGNYSNPMCCEEDVTGSKGPGSEGLPKVTCQPSEVMGQPVQRLWGRNEHVIKQQKGSEWTSAEYGCALGEMRSQSCDHGEDGTLTQGEIGVLSGTQAERCHRIFGLLVFKTEFFLQQF